MKAALVTGSTGFIGSHLTRALLRSGWRIQAALRDTASAQYLPEGASPVVVGDLSKNPDWSGIAANLDAVFHLAGKAHDTAAKDPASEYTKVNLVATQSLLEACRARGARRFIYFSSIKAADRATPYGQSKHEAEIAVLEATRQRHISGVSLRLSLVYGPGQKGNLLRLVRQIDRGFFPALRWVKNRRSMVHIDNVVLAALLAADSPKAAGQTYIVADAQPYSTATLCRLVREGLGKAEGGWDIPRPMLKSLAILGDFLGGLSRRKAPFDSEAFEKLCGDAFFNPSKIISELGYRPVADIQSAIPGIIECYRKGGV